ncbi:hypothetical protein [Dongia sp.]|uniref:hypothetical protein n=1 Tax=Dongia sp. TaxID=1977262 RepID=UPI003750A530
MSDTPSTSHGLVIGKFYPPHQGHHLLIRTAAAACHRVSVVVMASRVESIPLSDRVAWLAATHRDDAAVRVTGVMDEHRVDYVSEDAWAAHVALMRDGLAQLAAPPVTAVFTSEAYGPELARRFAATHVAVDPERRRVPISARVIRRDLVAGWEFLAPPTRAGLALRIAVAETLAADLVAHWRARGGAHALTRLALTAAEEDAAAAAGGPLLICGSFAGARRGLTLSARNLPDAVAAIEAALPAAFSFAPPLSPEA